MKGIGAFFCVAAFLFSGLTYLENEKRKRKSFGGLAAAFTVMKNELCAKLLPLSELLRRAAESPEDCVRPFFESVLAGLDTLGEKTFSEIWNEAAGKSFFPLFTPEQLGRLTLLGTVLGRSAGETQGDCLEKTAAFFSGEEERIKEKLPGERKLAIGLSACAGFLTVIALC